MIAPLTSLIESCAPTELIITNAKLKRQSKILTWYLKTTDPNRLTEKNGELSAADRKKLKQQLKKLFWTIERVVNRLYQKSSLLCLRPFEAAATTLK